MRRIKNKDSKDNCCDGKSVTWWSVMHLQARDGCHVERYHKPEADESCLTRCLQTAVSGAGGVTLMKHRLRKQQDRG